LFGKFLETFPLSLSRLRTPQHLLNKSGFLLGNPPPNPFLSLVSELCL
jgi:hypothetical protein